jgi:hypothetical protein
LGSRVMGEQKEAEAERDDQQWPEEKVQKKWNFG